MKQFLLSLAFVVTLFGGSMQAQQEARLLRFPTIHGNNITFTYAGDLYTVAADGGIARRLTSDVGYEMFARYSPDGKHLAFTGQYDGNTEVYVMPAEGGVPKRITITPTLSRDDVSDRMGPNNIVMTWKDNDEIVFRSRMREWNSFNGQLYTVALEGGLPQQLPLPRGGFCSYSPDGKKLAYNRVFREFRTWKRYRGGMADDVWIYDFDTKKVLNITNNPAQDIIPMWSGSKVYYISDRGRHLRMNLYSYDVGTRETKRLTDFSEYDIKFPSLGDKAIVFENGGYIYHFDLATEQATKVSIQILEDMSNGRGGLESVAKKVSNYEISPDGKRALFGARGDVFTVPASEGITRNLTNSPGVHERNSKWSPDGKWISCISDRTGEDEIWLLPQDGNGDAVQITRNADTYKYQPLWSPDGKKLMWSDKKLRLNVVDIDSKDVTVVAQADLWEFNDYTWSPDSKWIAYTRPEQDGMSKVMLHSLESGKSIAVTDGWFGSGNPAFSADGKYLFFSSSRTFRPRFSQLELTTIYTDMATLFFVTLDKDAKSLLVPRNDEVKVDGEDNGDQKTAKRDKKNDVTVKVDEQDLANRIVELPGSAGNYRSLWSVGNTLYYVRSQSGKGTKLFVYDFDKRKETELGSYGGFEISADTKKMILSEKGGYAIVSLPKSKIKVGSDDKVDTKDMKATLDRHAEWEQIFSESWRQMKYFFYDPGMHGVDWDAMREKYAVLVPHINHRYDLTYIIGEMISELNVGHAYTGGGDAPKPERIKLGRLGAELSRDASGYYRIDHILPGETWYKAARSPLSEVGVDANEGDYIIAIDGKPTNDVNNIYELLIDKADKTVELTVSESANDNDTRTSLIVPTENEQGLYYYNWIQENIRKVSEATDGRVGYVHIPDMGVGGYNEFVKYYYPQLMKEALIIDVRGNGGGFVSPMITERLMRDFALLGYARNSIPRTSPGAVNTGPKVCLLDQFSASDGDIFPYRFRYHNMGPLIGVRSWGGVVGIRGSLPLIDGGDLRKPEFAHYNVEGTEWVVEGKGVQPDIVVDNDPALEYSGTDQQLNRGIDEILKELNAGKGFKLNPPPPFPDKSE